MARLDKTTAIDGGTAKESPPINGWHRSRRAGRLPAARREQIRPEDVGLPAGTRRRVAGLRREEVATLAGISSAYYLRLEQGRVTTPSAQVVDALARALRLDARATRYLHDLTTQTEREAANAEAAGHALAEGIDQFLMPAALVNG
jgi:transcriptional regulator with XRE-family HTH domain